MLTTYKVGLKQISQILENIHWAATIHDFIIILLLNTDFMKMYVVTHGTCQM